MLMVNIDFESLRRDLKDYFGSAMFGGMPMAVIDLSDVEVASPEQLIEIARRIGFNINDYVVYRNDEPEENNSITFRRKY